MKTRLNNHLAVASLALLACTTAARGAVPIPITNAGFEDPVIAGDGTLGTLPTAWATLNGSGATIAGLNPSSTSDLTAEAPEGSNVGLVVNTSGDGGFAQVLTSKLQADATYSVSVQVANTKFTGGFPGYRVQLLAGGTLLAEDDNSLTPGEDSVVTSTVPYVYNVADAALVGQALEIRLLSKGGANEVAFDDVQLTVALASPAANPGGPYLVAIPDGSLALDGSGSLPSDGQTITTWEWDLDINDNGGVFNADVTGATPAAINYATLTTTYGMAEGANTIKLRVTDDASPTPKTSITSTTVTLAEPVTIYTGTSGSGGGDKWNVSGNWDSGVPSGAINAVIPDKASAFTVAVTSSTTPPYTGDLTIGNNVILQIGWVNGSQFAACYNAVGTPGSTTIYLGENSRIKNRNPRGGANWTVPAVVLNGNATFQNKESTESQTNPTFDYPVTGSHTLTLDQPGVCTFKAVNSFSALVATGGATAVTATAGTLGTGNVTINGNSKLTIGVANSIADSATLALSGAVTSQLTMNADETVGFLSVNGFPRVAGTYGRVGTPATVDFQVSWMAGNSVLTVTNEPADSVVNIPAITEPVSVFTTDFYTGNSITYTLTFDEVVTTTATTADFENTGSATVTIDSVTQTAENVVQVVVTATGPGSLTLGAKASAAFDDLFGNALNGPFADDVTFTVLAGPPPTLIITGTAGGGDSWNTGTNWDSGFPPFSSYPAAVAPDVTAQVQNAATSAYSGGLTLQAGSQLWINNAAGSQNALGTGPITFEGATIRMTLNVNPVNFPALVLNGNATFTTGGNTEDNKTRNFSGTISGNGTLTYSMRRGTVISLNGNNVSWSGGFVANNVDLIATNYSRVRADNGGFGTGSVTINNGISLEILSGRGDTIGNAAALHINGTGRPDIRKLALNSNETVGQFWLDGVQQAAGAYTSASGLLDSAGNPLIAGTGTLTVLTGPGGGPTYATWIAGYPDVGAMTGFTDDPDGDGNGNGLENFFGTDPSVFTTGVIAGTKAGNTFTFTHPQNASPASDVTAAYTWSTDLATFTAGGVANGGTTVSFSPVPNTPTAGTTTVTATVTGTAIDSLFVRVSATQN